MPRGGSRPRAGRPAGGKNIADKPGAVGGLAGKKYTPLEYMLAVMRDNKADPRRRDAMAVAAAKYIHGSSDGRVSKKAAAQADAERLGVGKGEWGDDLVPRTAAVQ